MVCMIHHCNPFVLVRHFIEKWTYKFSLMIKGENVGVNGDHQSKLVSRYFWPTINGAWLEPPEFSKGVPPVHGAQIYKGMKPQDRGTS